MRYKFTSQMNLFSPLMRSSIVKELKGISDILDATPSVMDRVFKDLTVAHRSDTGREGMRSRAGAAVRHPHAVPGIDV